MVNLTIKNRNSWFLGSRTRNRKSWCSDRFTNWIKTNTSPQTIILNLYWQLTIPHVDPWILHTVFTQIVYIDQTPQIICSSGLIRPTGGLPQDTVLPSLLGFDSQTLAPSLMLLLRQLLLWIPINAMIMQITHWCYTVLYQSKHSPTFYHQYFKEVLKNHLLFNVPTTLPLLGLCHKSVIWVRKKASHIVF